MAKIKIKPHLQKSPIKQLAERKAQESAKNLDSTDCFHLTFRHLDKTQGHTFQDWEKSEMLAHPLDVLASYCNLPLTQQVDNNKFTIYGNFPPSHKTDFTHPKHIPEDAKWARIHITGKQCVIGHVVGNAFYVVFLDGEHKFWHSELRNT